MDDSQAFPSACVFSSRRATDWRRPYSPPLAPSPPPTSLFRGLTVGRSIFRTNRTRCSPILGLIIRHLCAQDFLWGLCQVHVSLICSFNSFITSVLYFPSDKHLSEVPFILRISPLPFRRNYALIPPQRRYSLLKRDNNVKKVLMKKSNSVMAKGNLKVYLFKINLVTTNIIIFPLKYVSFHFF